MSLKSLVIILTYNEENTIETVIKETKEILDPTKIIVIDAYSTDNTIKIVQDLGIEIIFIDKMFGIGLAVEAGLLLAFNDNYDYLIRLDGDNQHTVSDVKKMFKEAAEKKYDLTIGSRFLDKSEYNPNLIRSFGINLLKNLINIFYKVRVSDCTSGCQIISKKLISEIEKDENFEYSEVGIICKASKVKLSIAEKFVNMKPRMSGQSSFNFSNSFVYMFRNLLDLITSFSFNNKKK